MTRPKYSVLLSIYANERPDNLRCALDSMLAQTLLPAEIVMVKDGPLTPELDVVLNEYDRMHPGLFKFVSYELNRGLGYALSQGILVCSNELVARMDTDDYSDPERMDCQIREFENDPDLDMLGTQVYEFIESPDKPISISSLPLEPDGIAAYSKRRNPFRHSPMVYKRSRVLAAGNYNSEYLYFEDWDLFNRMLALGFKGRNLGKALVSMRVSVDFFGRRGGKSYLLYIWKFKSEQLRRGYFTFSDFLLSFVPHAIVCLLPNGIRTMIYMRALRGTIDD